jgi:hypothetical protein
MEFDPSIHTKRFFIENPDVAYSFASTTDDRLDAFILSDSAQDIDVLSIRNDLGITIAHTLALFSESWSSSPAVESYSVLSLANNEGCTVAHILAHRKYDWVNSHASQRLDILKLADNKKNVSVAHTLAKEQIEWSKTPAAQEIEVLSLCDLSGMTVAHALADKSPIWSKSGVSQKIEILSLASDDGVTVAHRLALNQPEWRGSEAAKRKEVLMLNHKTLGSVAQVIMCQMPFKSDVLLTLVSSGAAYSKLTPEELHYRPTFHEVDITTFITQSFNLINDEQNNLIKLKILNAVYSTLKNLSFDFSVTQSEELLAEPCERCEDQILNMIATYPEFFLDTSLLTDFNCEPAMTLINHHLSRLNLQNSLQTINQSEVPLERQVSLY